NQSSTSGTLPSNTIPNPKGEMKAITTRSGVAYEGPSIPTPKKNQTSTSGTISSNTIPNPKGEMKVITTRSGVAYEGPSIPTNPSPKKVVERETEETTNKSKQISKEVPLTSNLRRSSGTLILGRFFLRTGRALIDFYGEEITLRVNDEAVNFNLNQTTRYSSTYDDMSVNQIDIIDVAREEYAQEILDFSKNSSGGNPTSTSEPIIFDSSLSLTLFEGSDISLEKIEAYLKDESISSEIDHADCDPDGDIFLIENLLNNDPFQLLPVDLKQREVAKAKSLIEEPSELELKDLPLHLEYANLEGVDKLPMIIAKDLKRMLEKVLADQRGRNVETYLEEIIIKSKSKMALVQDVKETLRNLKIVNIKIDLTMSSFRVMEGRFLGHMLAELRHPTCEAQMRMEKAKESGWTNDAEEALQRNDPLAEPL
nr:reverse transcriptase domain-containing protein [Tanacetum cinerariifolium]